MNTATAKQIEFINRLQSERDVYTVEAVTALNVARDLWRSGEFTVEKASKVIDVLKAQPFPQRLSETSSSVPEGMHRLDGRIYKVQRSPQTGRLYAKRLVAEDEDRPLPEDQCPEFRFEYDRGAVRLLSEATQMTLEQAKEFGHLYGVCCVCGRTLTNEESIAAGIGPICSGKGFAS